MLAGFTAAAYLEAVAHRDIAYAGYAGLRYNRVHRRKNCRHYATI